MTATEELRRLLDERGVEWGANDTYRLFVTSWSDASGHSWAFMEHRDGSFSKLTAYHLTPAQAIAATLRSGTCRRLPADNFGTTCVVRGHGYEMEFGYWKCSECGTNCFDGARYCMNCGARVVDEY